MNKLSRPNHDDILAITALTNNAKVASHPHLKPILNELISSYKKYILANGAPLPNSIVKINQELAKYLRSHYSSPPKDLHHINEMRDSTEHLVCPMCGSIHSGTLDHYLPKEDYPIFSVFSQNLVPACKCNSRRGRTLYGATLNERVLHPYFDNCLGERLISAKIEDLGPVPRMEISLIPTSAHPNFVAIRFHVDNIIQKSAIKKYLSDRWSSFFRKPSLVIQNFEKNITSKHEVKKILEKELDRLDDLHRSKNNWNSVFVSGLLSPPVTDWITQKLSQPGRVPDSPLN